MKNSVSIIIPNYNCSQWLSKVIESCLIQKHLHEIIIVDDSSIDNSWETMKKLQQQHPKTIKIYKNEKKGGNNARNLGFSKSSGTYIQWLDADDFLLKGKFESQIQLFEEYQEADIVYSDWYLDIYENNNCLIKREEHPKAQYRDFTYEIIADNWSANNSYLFKRDFAEKLHKINAWNPETKRGQDREYVTMAALLGANFYYVPGYYCIYNRWNINSVSASFNFKERWAHQFLLEKRFRRKILENNYSKILKRRYLSILNANAITACFYNQNLTILNSFSFFNINWSFIGWKKHPFVPFIYLWQHYKYFLKQRK